MEVRYNKNSLIIFPKKMISCMDYASPRLRLTFHNKNKFCLIHGLLIQYLYGSLCLKKGNSIIVNPFVSLEEVRVSALF